MQRFVEKGMGCRIARRPGLQYIWVYFKSAETGGSFMSMPKDEVRRELAQAWGTYMAALGKSMAWLEKHIDEAMDMAGMCTAEWCQATEHVIDDLNNALFSISEPRWIDDEQSRELKRLKRKIYDLYVNYRGIYASAA
jgi:hypothetical protein